MWNPYLSLTVHIFGRNDSTYKYSQELVSTFNAGHREMLVHSRMHVIPRGSEITSEMASIITKTVEESILLQ